MSTNGTPSEDNILLRFDSVMLNAAEVTASAQAVGDDGPLSPRLTNF